MDQITTIRLSALRESPFNPRKAFAEADLEELSLSIASQGVLQPIVVRPAPNRPIIFSDPMVRALLAGSKTQTRRVVKSLCRSGLIAGISADGHPIERVVGVGTRLLPCPYGKPGDQLWVRETFAIVPRTAYRCSEGVQQVLRPDDDHDAAIFRAGWDRSRGGFRWRPSIHMPRWASRILLEVTDVRAERLQDISRGDAMDEGCPFPNMAKGDDPRQWYADLWDQINGPGSWDSNPWVWCVSFERQDSGGCRREN